MRGEPSAVATFVSFAVDSRHGWIGEDEVTEKDWRRDTFTGCVYPDSGEVFVKRGSAYLSARVLLGKKAEPDENACRAAQTEVAVANPAPVPAGR